MTKKQRVNFVQSVSKDRRLRSIWCSNGVNVPSGYGVFQRDLLYRLLNDGWPVAQVAYVGVEGGTVNIDGLPVYPKMADPFGTDGLFFHGQHFRADINFVMQDVWTLNGDFLAKMPHFIPYVPIDQSPVPPNVIEKLRFAYKIITFSRFGQKALEEAGYTSTLILESTDTNIFKPLDKQAMKAKFGIPQERFVFGMIGANKDNPPRKGWQEALDAFKLFHDRHPEALLFFQTNQPAPTGFPIQQYAHYLGLDGATLTIDPYNGIFHFESPQVCEMLNACDVLLHPSATEGFGLVIIESQASGTPVIVNDCTSMPELVIPGVTGEICKTGRKHLTPAMGYMYFADPLSLYDKMEAMFVADRKKMGEAARKHIVENYNIETSVRDQWIPLLENLQQELLPPLQTLPKDVK